MLASANNLAMSLSKQGKYAEAEEMLQETLAACRRVLGSAHPDTLATAESLESVRSAMRFKQPAKHGVKAAVRKERAAVASLSPTALAEAEASASAAEAELLAMLDLEEPEAGTGGGSGSAKGKLTRQSEGQGDGQGEGARR